MTRPAPDLSREWHRRLASSGFRDIETGPQHDGLLRTDKRVEADKGTEYAAQAEYYRKAASFAHRHRFVNGLERRVWLAHAEGKPYRQIARECRTYVKLVHETVGRLRTVMLTGKAMGRPPKPEGRHRDCWRLTVRLTDAETEALFFLAQLLSVPPAEAARIAIRVCVDTKSGNSGAQAEREHGATVRDTSSAADRPAVRAQ